MKIKLFLASIFLCLLGALTLSQADLVSAVGTSASGPITSARVVQGKAYYRVLNFFVNWRTGEKFPIWSNHPVTSAIVKATNTKTNQIYTTATDAQGQYSFNLNQDRYIISISNTQTIRFNPAQRVVELGDRIINFQGTLLNQQ